VAILLRNEQPFYFPADLTCHPENDFKTSFHYFNGVIEG